jgi:hypothetical protein
VQLCPADGDAGGISFAKSNVYESTHMPTTYPATINVMAVVIA